MNALRDQISAEIAKVSVGQQPVLDQALIALGVGGHALIEGPPGVAKTMLATALAQSLGLTFRRVQFTPDMLPSDLTGTMTVRDGSLTFRPGPVFTNVLLADEINRTPPKTQAALLEAMQEGQVTVDGVSRPLPRPFLVLATQNPIEFDGTYPLPEAQLDRFLIKITANYPDHDQEVALLKMARRGLQLTAMNEVATVASVDQITAAMAEVDAVTVSPDVTAYAATIVRATREQPGVALGASPRAGVHLIAAARATAAIKGRTFVTPDDIAAMAVPVLGHRIVMRPEAEIERYTAHDVLGTILRSVAVPR
jgi:MoxR-like ATPase